MAETNFFDLAGDQLPYSLEAEQSLLGAILIDPDSILQISDTLRAEHFHLPQHKAIYESVSAMFEQNKTIDFVTLLEWLKTKGVYDEAGGKEYLNHLVGVVQSSANIETYANIIREKYIVRELIVSSRLNIEDAVSGKTEPGLLLDAAEERIFNIRQSREISGLRPIGDIIQNETFVRLSKLADETTRKDYLGIPCGISSVDRYTTGLNKSDLIVIGARPGVGKTAFCLNIARNVAVQQNKTVCFFSLEMSRDQLAQRMLSNEACIKSEKLRTGELSKEDYVNLGKASETFSKAPLYFDETPGITVRDIKAKVRRMKGKCDLVMIDYLGLLGASSKKENRVQEVSENTRNLKIMAKELNIPVVVCAQLNRSSVEKGTNRIPSLSDLRESGSIEQDADIVIFLHREAYGKGAEEGADPHAAKCIIAKNRHGEAATVDLHWDGQFTRFTSQDGIHNAEN